MSEQISPFLVKPLPQGTRQRLIGWTAAVMTVVIWSSYFLSLRAGALSGLSKEELLLMRYAAPGLLLLPVFVRALPAYRNTPWLYLLGISLGSGVGFFLLSAMGMARANVMQGSTLIPGAAPLFVTLLAVTLFKQALPQQRLLGLGFVLAGVLTLVFSAMTQFNTQLIEGQLLLLGCALMWAIFTVSVRQADLQPLQVAALVTVPNGAIIGIWVLLSGDLTLSVHLSTGFLLTQLLVQGILVGILSGWFYATAIRRLGAENTSAIGSMTPVIASVFAFLILQESLEFISLLGLCLTSFGVYKSARAQ